MRKAPSITPRQQLVFLAAGLLTVAGLFVISVVAMGFDARFGLAAGLLLLVIAFAVPLPRAARTMGWLVGLFGLTTSVVSVVLIFS